MSIIDIINKALENQKETNDKGYTFIFNTNPTNSIKEAFEKAIQEAEHPADCLCAIPFIEGKSVPIEMSEEICEVLRDNDQVRFSNKAPWVNWNKVKESALDTYFTIQIKERPPEPKKEEYYLYDRVKKSLIYLGNFDSRVAATDASMNNYPHVSGTLVTDTDIIMMQELLWKL